MLCRLGRQEAPEALLRWPRRRPLVEQVETTPNDDEAHGDAYAAVKHEGYEGGSHYKSGDKPEWAQEISPKEDPKRQRCRKPPNEGRCAATVPKDAGAGRPANRPSRRTWAPGARFPQLRRQHQRLLASRCTASCPAEGAAWESNPVRASAPVNIVGIEPTAPTFPEETVHGIPNLAVRRLHEGRMAWLTRIPQHSWTAEMCFCSPFLPGQVQSLARQGQ